MRFFALASLASLVSGIAIDRVKRDDTPLEVTLTMAGNTAVKASIKNNGASDLKLTKTGTLLDSAPVEKVGVFKDGKAVEFQGIRMLIKTDALTEDVFQTIAAGDSYETEFDIAEFHDLSEGGEVEIFTEGSLAYAEADSTEIAGAVAFSSNKLTSSVDGAQAKTAHHDFIQKRIAVQSDCTGSRRTAQVNAVNNCRSLASQAASQARSNSARMVEYFKSSSSSTVSTVATVFDRVASQCGSTSSGTPYYCTDVLRYCSGNVIAYTETVQSVMVNCPLFFNGLPAASRSCHAQDQQTTIIHEVTHLRAVKGTSDYNGYGYNYVRSLSAAQNLNHADTYTLFAQSIYAGC